MATGTTTAVVAVDWRGGVRAGMGSLRQHGGVEDGSRVPGELSPETLAAARRRDHAAFALIVEHFDARLRALAWHLLRDEQTLRDVLQDAYVKAYLALPGFRGDADLGTWLYRIVYTTCLNQLRGEARRPHPVGGGGAGGGEPDRLAAADPAVPDVAEGVAATLDLASLLAALPVEQRAAVMLVDAQGFGYAQAAAILDVPQGTVASRVASARAKLRAALADRIDLTTTDGGTA
ncbi:MAG TPA: RNA polymerase sigma factor, partial [Thermoleophilia bacterium]|nr:RNA polymerase sigma factor [Thermoleophilia bacterium]